MKPVLEITEFEDILSVNNIIHDCLFEKDKIAYDSKSSILTIYFNYESIEKKEILKRILFLKKIRIPIFKYILKISNVQSYQIVEDTQGCPGSDDYFNIIVYDSQKKQILIKTTISKGIDVKVDKLKVSIENSSEQVGEKIFFGL